MFAVWVANRRRIAAETVGRAEEQALRIVKDAERDAETRKKEALLEAKEKAHEILIAAERQARQERQQAAALEQTLAPARDDVADRETAVERLEKELQARERAVSEREKQAAGGVRQVPAARRAAAARARAGGRAHRRRGQGAAPQADREPTRGMTPRTSLKRLDAEAREVGRRPRQAVHHRSHPAHRAAEHAIETTVSVVDLPSDDLKGRIIGREGRNIRALELATGVDLIVDDTPGAIILSGFDPYRREIAKKAIERLIADGRIHPARIEEVVQKVKDETDEEVRKEGAAVAFELGLHDLHPEILRLMGRLKFRTSYGQNVLSHSAEVARLAGIMAREIGLDAHVAVRAAFLHDIGKAIDREMEGTHLQIGIDFLRKHGESEAVVMAMAAHHMDIDWPSLEAMIVQAADAISAARPGARRDILESYVKRLEKLEGIADSFKGVSKSFALQAGREIRIMVESEKISDEEAVWLSKDIARRIENELEYPGQIKVTVIRETRAVDYAK